MLTPDYLRRTLWTPPRTREPGTLLARSSPSCWRVRRPQLADRAHAPILVDAIVAAEVEPPPPPPAVEPEAEDESVGG